MQLEEITDKKVLVRLDYNVPIEDGIIVNDFRIRQTYNTLNSLLDNNNKLIIASHLGRPTEGSYDESLTRASEDKLYKICAWYDNEWGFSNRMLDVTNHWIK